MRMKKCVHLVTNGRDCICELNKTVLGDIMGYDGSRCRDCIVMANDREDCIVMENDREDCTLLIKYHRGVQHITQIDKGDWIDLRIAEDVALEAGEFKLIPLGVSIALPKGYEALMIPRSSTFKKYGLIQANSLGLIDETYCGDNDEWYFPAYATRDTLLVKNTRICQFRILKHQPTLALVEVDHLSETDRGGFGSTGEN